MRNTLLKLDRYYKCHYKTLIMTVIKTTENADLEGIYDSYTQKNKRTKNITL